MTHKIFAIAFLLAMISPLSLFADPPISDPIQKICGGTCSGKLAWVQSWQDSGGQVRVYEYQGDLTVCSHPPRIYYDAQGAELGAMPEFPVDLKDPASVAKASQGKEKVDNWLQGLVAGPRRGCGK